MKITDLEKFALEQIYRPYARELWKIDTKVDRLSTHYDLDDVLLWFEQEPEWRDLVMKRIVLMEFEFPKYINHPLVDYIKIWIREKC